MPKQLWCEKCQLVPKVLVVNDNQMTCASCGNVVAWFESDNVAFTLTHMDRRFLKSLRIAGDEHEVKN